MPTRSKRAFALQTGLQPKQMRQMLAHYTQKKETSRGKHSKGSSLAEDTFKSSAAETLQPPPETSRTQDVAIFDYSIATAEKPAATELPAKASGVRIMVSLHSNTPIGMLCARIKPIESAGGDTLPAKVADKPPPLVVIRDQTEISVPADLCNQPEVALELLDASGTSVSVKVSLVDGHHQILTLAEFGNVGVLLQTFC